MTSGPDVAVSGAHLTELLKARDNGASDALNNQPTAGTALESSTEKAARARIVEFFEKLKAKVTTDADGVSSRVRERVTKFTETSYDRTIAGLDAEIQAILGNAKGSFARAWSEALRQHRHYEYFKIVNELRGDPKYDKWQFLLLFITLPLLVETLINSHIFSQASNTGLVGGAAMAFFVSVGNVILGFCAGLWPLRYISHVKKSHMLWAVPLFSIFVVGICSYNLLAAHYRELLIAQPDAAVHAAWPQFLANPFGFADFMALLLILIGLAVALLSGYKGYTSFGKYPGHKTACLNFLNAHQALQQERVRLDTDILPQIEKVRGRLEDLNERCRAELEQLGASRAELDAIAGVYSSGVARLRSSRDEVVANYRAANAQVRTDALPAYFGSPLAIDLLDSDAELAAISNARRLIADAESMLVSLPVEAERKYRAHVDRIKGVDFAVQIEKVKTKGEAEGRAVELAEHNERARMRQEVRAEF